MTETQQAPDPRCPDETTLVQFALGKAGAQLAAVETHLDGCESCRRQVAAASSEQTLPTAPVPVELTPGIRVGRYQIERELGRGGMGVVYMARDVTLDRRVALKLLHQRHQEESQARLLREAQVMARLAHPNVVPVFELGEWRNELFLVMELVNGVTLEQWLKGARHSKREILAHFVAAGRGLAAAHAAGVIHRDFKPANVLVGIDDRVRVTDFGLSRPGGPSLELPPLASPLVTRQGAIMGTLAYMAPEQLDGKSADERSDQFAFCVSVAEALGGERPFEGDSWSALSVALSRPPKLAASIPSRLRAVLRKGLARDPSQRHLSMTALLNAIERAQAQALAPLVAVGAAAALALGVFGYTRPPVVPPPAIVVGEVPEELVPVVVAARDLESGTRITFDLLQQRSIPRHIATTSFIKPDSASYIINEKLLDPVQAGDPLLSSRATTRTGQPPGNRRPDAGARSAPDKVRRAMALRLTLAALALLLVAGCNCSGTVDVGGTGGGDGGRKDGGGGGTGGGLDGGGGGSAGDGGQTDGGGLGPVCDNGRCNLGEVCVFGQCLKDCGGALRCGTPTVCCGTAEICYLGACTLPGASCVAATSDGGASSACPVQTTCPMGQTCELSLGKCLPSVKTNACEFKPPVGQFTPQVKWEWQSSTVLPTYDQIMMTPVVADLDNDCMPDVVFSTFAGGNYSTAGVIRAVRGDGSRELWTAVDPTLRSIPGGQIALGDVDNDGKLEVFVCHESRALLALNFDGTKKWLSADLPCATFDAPHLADVDHDGVPEVIVGYSVHNARTGAAIGTAPSVASYGSYGAYTTAAELDGVVANGLEIVGGGVVYHWDGTLYWDVTGGTAGYPAVADLDADGLPDVVSVAGATHSVTAYKHDGTVLWGPVDVNNGVATPAGPSGGGPPTIADFDGDGMPDVAMAGGYGYLVLKGQTGAVLWQSTATTDTSSRITGSSVFDFEGDGKAEAVYNDEHNMRVYDGKTGAELVKLCSMSGTLWENPVIVDVDGDDHAEIVVMNNNYAFPTCDADVGGGPSHTGFKVIGDALKRWVRTRRIWNQHTYRVSNINDDGTVPKNELDNWKQPGLNNFRQNVQTKNVLAAPDLVPSDLRAGVASCPAELLLTAVVLNQGEATAPAGVKVTFFTKDANGATVVIKTVVTTGPIFAGASERVSFAWTPAAGTTGPIPLWVVVDDDGAGVGAVNECDEVNNKSATISIGCTQIN